MITRRRLLLVWLGVVSLVSACSGTPAPTSSPFLLSPSDGPSPSPSVSSGPATITLAFGGDVHFIERTLTLLDNPAIAFGPISTVLSGSDVAMVNLETAVTTGGTPEPKQYHFRAPASAYTAVKAAGVDLVSLANNHTLDYGQVGLADTLASASSLGMPVVGAGANADAAYAPYFMTVKGVRIAFLAFSQITELASTWVATSTRPGLAMAIDPAQISLATAAVAAARAAADVVVVFMHWGQEYNECPIALQRTAAAAFAAAGATMIVGTHAHVMQGDGWLGSTYVAYGMSNFVWWYNDAQSNDTGVIRVTLTGRSITGTEFLPAYIDRTTGQPLPVAGTAEGDRIAAEHAALRSCTGLASAPS